MAHMLVSCPPPQSPSRPPRTQRSRGSPGQSPAVHAGLRAKQCRHPIPPRPPSREGQCGMQAARAFDMFRSQDSAGPAVLGQTRNICIHIRLSRHHFGNFFTVQILIYTSVQKNKRRRLLFLFCSFRLSLWIYSMKTFRSPSFPSLLSLSASAFD